MTRTIKPAKAASGQGGGSTPHFRVAVVGTGFSGLGMAIRLKQQGIDDFVVLERAEEIGGTWRDNSYPGCACDVMSLLYSFSFAQNPNWKTTFGKRDEIYAYLRECADRFGVRPHVRFNHELTAAKWNDLERRWYIETSQGNFTAQVLVTGTGYLSDPVLPTIEGLDSFQGAKFHSANWDHDFDLTGKRVAVIGTGASAIQFVPKLQEQVGQLYVHQRTAPWVGPKADKVISKGQLALRKNMPGYQNFRRNFNMWGREILAFMLARPKMAVKTIQGMAEKNLKTVKDDALRAKLTPDYTVGCKRLLFSNDWYPALQQSNVEVVTDGIVRVEGNSVVTADGRSREVDAIIMGTGFQATDRPVAQQLWGKDGIKLADAWSKGMSAYAGTTVAGFPNLFMLLGPNTTLGHSSQTVMIEAQIAHVLDALKLMDKRELSSVEVRAEAQTAYNERLDAKLEDTVWTAGGCQSWYQDGTERNPSIWPTYTWRFRKATKRVVVGDYRIAASVGDAKQAVTK
jgi:cation diffusion facilitator CzcD-associated flavoprotein CzcO